MKLTRHSKRLNKRNRLRYYRFPLVLRRVSGHSMDPALSNNTYILCFGWFRRLRAGDVIMFSHEGVDKVKRLERHKQDGSLHVLGDNPNRSTDSRHFGAIPLRTVRAKVIWPSARTRRR